MLRPTVQQYEGLSSTANPVVQLPSRNVGFAVLELRKSEAHGCLSDL
jgi:hypothetical protein